MKYRHTTKKYWSELRLRLRALRVACASMPNNDILQRRADRVARLYNAVTLERGLRWIGEK